MAIIARLAGEGVGPFRRFDFDFSDAGGKPHLGPHLFAGVNGSGKSTVLRTIAWMLESRPRSDGFQWEEWQHVVQGYDRTRALAVIDEPGIGVCVIAKTMDASEGWLPRLREWVNATLANSKIECLRTGLPLSYSYTWPAKSESTDAENFPAPIEGRLPQSYMRLGGPEGGLTQWPEAILTAGYGPSRLLKYLPQVNPSARLPYFRENALSFEATVQNEAIQSWLVGLFSKKAIATERRESTRKYSAALERFEEALTHLCGQEVRFTVDIEPSLQPRLLMYHKRLDFSQLPDGVRSTVGWLADFLMRMDSHDSVPEKKRVGVLLLDEVDAHLHPKWQRSILPAIKRALPQVQVFATSHSPFVIASCPGAKIHVLELDDNDHASNRPAEDAPVGESILATMKDIFEVNRFDVATEELLKEWNRLRRCEAADKLNAGDKLRLAALTRDLSARSEELRQLVAPVAAISDAWIASLNSPVESASTRTKSRERK